jgi:hypothetical protein
MSRLGLLLKNIWKMKNGELRDYKLFCFNGIPKIFLLYKDRYDEKNMTIDFF